MKEINEWMLDNKIEKKKVEDRRKIKRNIGYEKGENRSPNKVQYRVNLIFC
jgi:hypothetical protein